ncbi:MAG: ferredoxin [Actinobacteria bacterium]|nr:ferredoxin [Actinomycetota bacterium]
MEAEMIFDIDPGTGTAVVIVEVVPEDMVAAARRAAASCPVSAIRLVD